MLQWVRGLLYGSDSSGLYKLYGHMFMVGNKTISFKRFGKGNLPPFDALSLTLDEAVCLRDFLNEAIDDADAF